LFHAKSTRKHQFGDVKMSKSNKGTVKKRIGVAVSISVPLMSLKN